MIFLAVMLLAEIMPAGTQGKDARHLALASSHFLGSEVQQGCFVHPFRKALYSFLFLQNYKWCDRSTKGSKESRGLRSVMGRLPVLSDGSRRFSCSPGQGPAQSSWAAWPSTSREGWSSACGTGNPKPTSRTGEILPACVIAVESSGSWPLVVPMRRI